MNLWNLYILHKFKPIWLRKMIASLLGFLAIYPILLYNQESALLLSLFLATFLYRKLKQETALKEHECNDFIIGQFLASLFCACMFLTEDHIAFALQAGLGVIFLRIYDFYKPSLIGRFHTFTKNLEFGKILAVILQGILSGLSVLATQLLISKLATL